MGDTIREGLFTTNEYLVVSEIDTIRIAEQLRKRIHFKDYEHIIWIEGIGNERGLLFYSGELQINGLWGDLVCFVQDEVNLYHNSSYTNCSEGLPNQVNQNIDNSSFRAFPNPSSSGFVTIEFNQAIKKIEVFSLSGELMLAEAGSGSNVQQINISHLPSGFYILRLTDKPGQVFSRKMLVSN